MTAPSPEELVERLEKRAAACEANLEVCAENGYEAELAHLQDEASDLRAAAALIRELVGKEKWQPIETAPKDGTHVLGYFKTGTTYRETWWSEKQAADHGMGWLFSQNGLTQPTHWRPLPAPPVEAK